MPNKNQNQQNQQKQNNNNQGQFRKGSEKAKEAGRKGGKGSH
jgi:general stress protein YciG